ncbi:Glycine/D-amino acid oxidases (deaminating) [Rubrobacter radiotolerans]|uniref:FAD-dependent oxidoreductase n=1 Tax=Rubrobacter radiotolerans TaxID=42256 RepID=A0A023WZV8_RUBRA|nr:FAD-dependent oxidoreductase [Rubrobacter radiotolerans]AHY45349.1 Glycine/D-amino acid oxidases (deaminating) [Rubrobacter radiotolerans]MDX5892760.1 FAD-dependent oxidoreductase [Rubrobacter radiotolerans]SMC02437.1 Glycine/D-amino acid oxidase [Rubrobacter radiotolerans DSM 5868]
MPQVAVIGAGIVGASVAYWLARGGADVTLLDASDPADGTTGRSFAWVNANNKTPRGYFDLNLAGMREHVALQRELGGEWLRRTGNTIVSKDGDALRRKVRRLSSWGYEARLLSGEELERVEPGVRLGDSFPDASAAHFPGESWADAPQAAGAIVSSAAELGAELRFGVEVVGVEAKATGLRVTFGDGKVFEADTLVNACGPDGAAVAGLLGRRLPLDVFPGLVVSVSAPEGALRGLLHTPEVNLRPDGPGRLAVHHDSVDGRLGRESPDALADELLERAEGLLPALEGSKVLEVRPGRRPVPGDGYPSVGAVAGVPGYYEAVTHSGVTLGPLIGRLLAEEILSGRVDPLLEPYRPDRF